MAGEAGVERSAGGEDQYCKLLIHSHHGLVDLPRLWVMVKLMAPIFGYAARLFQQGLAFKFTSQ